MLCDVVTQGKKTKVWHEQPLKEKQEEEEHIQQYWKTKVTYIINNASVITIILQH